MCNCGSGFNLLKRILDVLLIHALPDSFASPTPGGLEHDWVANLCTGLDGLLDAVDTCLQYYRLKHLLVCRHSFSRQAQCMCAL